MNLIRFYFRSTAKIKKAGTENSVSYLVEFEAVLSSQASNQEDPVISFAWEKTESSRFPAVFSHTLLISSLHRGCSLGRFATLARTDLWDMPRAMNEARFNRKRHVSRAHFFAPFNSLRA